MRSDSDSRSVLIDRFLTEKGWGQAARHPLNQDASTRRYIRLVQDGRTALLMDAPPIEDSPCPPAASDHERRAMGWNATARLAASRVEAFTAIAGYLRADGLSAPEVLAAAPQEGLALIEDFGSALEFAQLIARSEADETQLYTAASEVLAHLHRRPAPTQIENWPILDYDALALQANIDLFPEWLPAYDERFVVSDRAKADWQSVRDGLIDEAITMPRTFILRDYHAENLLWLPDRVGLARVGLLDFQDAINGWDGWELAMLLQDARRKVSQDAHDSALRHYCDLSGKDMAPLKARLAICGTLNALRITGLFARLIIRDKKARYGRFMTRQQALLAENLTHPATRDMAAYVRTYAPFIFEARL